MTGTPPPPIRVRLPRRKERYGREPRALPFQVAADRPVAPYIQHTNILRDAPFGTRCILSTCRYEARYMVTFHQTGGTWPYCDEHVWPFRPRREIRQRGLAAMSSLWEDP